MVSNILDKGVAMPILIFLNSSLCDRNTCGLLEKLLKGGFSDVSGDTMDPQAADFLAAWPYPILAATVLWI